MVIGNGTEDGPTGFHVHGDVHEDEEDNEADGDDEADANDDDESDGDDDGDHESTSYYNHEAKETDDEDERNEDEQVRGFIHSVRSLCAKSYRDLSSWELPQYHAGDELFYCVASR